MSASAGAVLNAVKYFCKVEDDIKLIPRTILEPIINLKKVMGKNKKVFITLKDALVALAIASSTNDMAKKCLDKLPLLRDCQLHSTCILNASDESTLRSLGINVTCEPEFMDHSLYENK